MNFERLWFMRGFTCVLFSKVNPPQMLRPSHFDLVLELHFHRNLLVCSSLLGKQVILRTFLQFDLGAHALLELHTGNLL